jgi:hypothetical protein
LFFVDLKAGQEHCFFLNFTIVKALNKKKKSKFDDRLIKFLARDLPSKVICHPIGEFASFMKLENSLPCSQKSALVHGLNNFKP